MLFDTESTDENFTGEILITDLQGNFVNGFVIKNGLITLQYQQPSNEIQSKITSSNDQNKGDGCDDCPYTNCGYCELDEVEIESNNNTFADAPDIDNMLWANNIKNNWVFATSGGTGGGAYPNVVIVNPTVYVEAPDTSINNMSDYLDCFDTSQSGQDAKITIYVDEPVDGSNELVGADGVGHAFVSIQQGNNIATFGFYPISSLLSLYVSVDGIMGDNSNTTYDVSITIDNVPTTEFTNGTFSTPLQSIINHVIAFSNSNYDINGQNCTDLAIDIANMAGLPMPPCNANPIYFYGSTPGRAGEYIRNLTTLPTGVTKDLDGGISSDNNCN